MSKAIIRHPRGSINREERGVVGGILRTNAKATFVVCLLIGEDRFRNMLVKFLTAANLTRMMDVFVSRVDGPVSTYTPFSYWHQL